jgi:hypothetical protein
MTTVKSSPPPTIEPPASEEEHAAASGSPDGQPEVAAPRRPDTSYHVSVLAVSSVVLSLSLLLSTSGPEQVIVPVLNLPLPGLCMTKTLLGLDCPGCGMTRCFISIAHGDLAAAWSFNPAGLLFFGLVVSQLPLRALVVWQIRTGRKALQIGRWMWPLWAVVAVLLVQWGVKMTLRMIG